MAQLAQRLGFGDAYTQGLDESQWVNALIQSSTIDHKTLAAEGIWRTDPKPRVALADFCADPAAHPLMTGSGLIEIENPVAEQYGLPSIPSYLAVHSEASVEDYSLQLLTPHHRLRSNSCLAANPWLQGLEQHAVWISAADAKARGIRPWEQLCPKRPWPLSEQLSE